MRDFAKLEKSHQRKLVDCSDPAYKNMGTEFLNPTNGSWWIVQIPPPVIESKREEAGLERSTNFRWWDSEWIRMAFGRLDLKNPPTAMGGISEF